MIITLFQYLFHLLWILISFIPYLVTIGVGLVSMFLAFGALNLYLDKVTYDKNYLVVFVLLVVATLCCFISVIYGIIMSTYVWLFIGPAIFSLLMVTYN